MTVLIAKTLWIEGCRNILPRVDQIMFMARDKNGLLALSYRQKAFLFQPGGAGFGPAGGICSF